MNILIREEPILAIAREQLRQIISENDINSVSDVYELFRESFKDMLQKLLEAEMDVSIGYPKMQKMTSSLPTNGTAIHLKW
ncbi:hypothetical protein BN3456_01413 [Clostridium sp. C105KSO13]|nr:hypothetical protein BN3456_01413 [Clostridium sp. C105KSO13]